jgi:hypothetical protein
MPSYNYLCDSCGLFFDKAFKLGKNPDKCTCSCGSIAEIQLSEDIAYEFDIKTEGLNIQNSGVVSLDYDYDTIIGNDAKQRWKTIEERDSYKRSLIKDTNGARERDLMVIYNDKEDSDYKLWNIQQKRRAGKLRLQVEKLTKIKLT